MPAGTFGPYVGQGRDGALLVWAPSNGDKRSWFTLPIAANGSPSGGARRVAEAASEIGLVAVRGSLDAANLVVVSTRRTGLGEWVEAMLVRGNGEIAMPPRALAELRTQALWVDATPFAERTFVMWATKNDELADIYGVALDARGEPKSDPVALARGVRAWQSAPFAGGTALGVVRPKGERAAADRRGHLVRRRRPAARRPGRAERRRATGARLRSRAARRPAGRRVVRLARRRKPRLPSARREGRSRDGPRSAAHGAARRTGARAGAVAPWLAQGLGRLGESRRSATARCTRSTWRASATTVASRRNAAASRWNRTTARCPNSPRWATASLRSRSRRLVSAKPIVNEVDVMPTFVRFGPTLDVLASEPLRLESLGGGPAELGWGLTCGEEACFSLAALGKAPAPVYVVELARRSDAFTPAARRLGDEARPRLRENRVLAQSEPLAALALARAGAGSVAAVLTDFDPTTPWARLKKPAPDGRFEPLRARLTVLGLRARRHASSRSAGALGARALARRHRAHAAADRNGGRRARRVGGRRRRAASSLHDAARSGRCETPAAHADAKGRRRERRRRFDRYGRLPRGLDRRTRQGSRALREQG